MISIINILFDEDAKEADVELASKDVSIKCYCHPAENLQEIYDSINNGLLAFFADDIMLDNIQIPTATKTDISHYSYFLRGAVISSNEIKINDFVIDIGPIPKDIKIGEFVSCQCMRVDMLI